MTPTPSTTRTYYRPAPPPPTQNLTGMAKWAALYRELIADNPMLNESKRETRKLFRTGKGGAIIGIGLFALLYVWLVFQSFIAQMDNSQIFSYIELIILTLGIPASIHACISGERERQTWDALILTRLTPGQILVGKLIWRFRLIGWLVVLCFVPMIVSRISDKTSDINTSTFILSQLMLIAWGIMLCTFGMLISSITKRSITSLAVIAGSLFAVLALLPGLYAMFVSILIPGYGLFQDSDLIGTVMGYLNPFSALTIMLASFQHNSASSVFTLKYFGTTGLLQLIVYSAISIVCGILTYFKLKKLEMRRSDGIG